MSVALLTRRYLAEYVRNPVNLLLLVLVPIVFVTMAAGTLADLAKISGGTGSPTALEASTVGWAAAFLTGIGAYFQVRGAQAADRRLAHAGLGAAQVVAARLLSGLGLALLASAVALLALAVRTGIADLPRTVAATALYALIYLGIGTLVGVLVRDELNGAVALFFIWGLDIFFGPTMIGGDPVLTRFFPTHFAALFLVNAPVTHGGPLGNLGWALLWTVGALLLAGLVFAATLRPAAQGQGDRAAGNGAGVAAAFRYSLLEYSRNPVLWVLLVLVPALFVRAAVAVTPAMPDPVALDEHGRRVTRLLTMTDVHAATMAGMAVAFLAGLAGVFVVLGSAEGDRRLVLAGFGARTVLASRLGVLALMVLLATGVSLLVTVPTFMPRLWLSFVAGTVLLALTYGLIGVLAGPVVGRMGGLYLLFLLPFVDVGLGQSPLFQVAPPTWATFLPGYGAMRLVVDGGFAADFSALGALLLALLWLVAIAVAAVIVFRRVSEPATA
jgi:hypothetical protein